MENKQDGSTRRRQLLPPLYPAARSANTGRASHHLLSSRPLFFRYNPAATHFAAQPSPYGSGPGATPGSSSFQMPPSSLSHAGASGHGADSVGGSSALQAWHLYQSSLSGSGWKASGSSHQRPPSPPSQAHASGSGADGLGVLGGNSALLQSQGALSGSSYRQMPPPSPLAMDPTSVRRVDGSSGGSSFVSSLETASVMVPTRTQPLSSSSVGQESSNEYELPPLPPTLPPLQTTTVELEDAIHAAREHIPPVDDEAPLPPCGPPPSETTTELEDILRATPQGVSLVGNDNAVDIVGRQYMDLDSINSSGDMSSNNNYTRVHCPPLAWSSVPIPADARMKMNIQPLDWSSRHPSSSTGMPRPYFSSNTNAMQAASQPVTLTFNSQLPALAQMGTNTGSGSSSTWMQKQKEPIFVETKPPLPPLPSPGAGWAGSSAGSSSRGRPRNKDEAKASLVADFADGLFTQNEINVIMGEKTLAEKVVTNPKIVRRIIRNRSTAQRGKERKMAYVSDLESKAELLQQEHNSLSERVQSMKSTVDQLANENNMMKVKLQGLEQHHKLMNDLNEALLSEVQRLTQLQQSQQSQGEA
ncbi:hypothetical protein ZWY2020_039420 [Hordeum vulgare]|nr:hypothetical protein ZWY2020_039420 [Hordeum vulgare]